MAKKEKVKVIAEVAEKLPVYFVKIAGEEFFCRFPNGRKAPVMAIISNPMILDTYADGEGGRYVVLTRYCPYVADPSSFRIDQKDIIFAEKVGPAMADYYEHALEVAVTKKDAILIEAIQQAIEAMVKKKTDPIADMTTKSNSGGVDELKENLALSTLAQFSKSKH